MKIKISQYCALMFIIMASCFIGILDISLINLSGIDCWIIPILGMIVGLPILYLYLYIYDYKKDLNINQLLIHLFGTLFGKILAFILLLFYIILALIIFNNLVSFINVNYLYNTPSWFINVLFIISIFNFFSKSETTIYRSTLMLCYIIFILLIISSINLTWKIQITNFNPILSNGISSIFNCLLNYIAYTIIPIFVLLITPKNKIDYKNINNKILITYFISHIIISIFLFLLIGVFGINLSKLYEYPIYNLLKEVFIGGFIERLENILSIGWIIILFVSCSFNLYYSTITIKDIFSFKNKKYIYLILLFVLFMGNFIKYILYKIYPIISIIIVIIMIIIFIKILIKKI